MQRRISLEHDGEAVDLLIEESATGMRVRLGDTWHEVEMSPAGRSGLYSALIDGRSLEVFADGRPGGWDVLIRNRVYRVDRAGSRTAGATAEAAASGAWVLRSPLTGMVVDVRVRTGDSVEAGQVLLIVESMKMNNELAAARAGVVNAVNVRVGERVERGSAMLSVE